jgi:holo-[acyl-carrier protein] synthase
MTVQNRLAVVVGVDLVRIGDVNDSIARFGDRYTERLFTPDEIGYCREQPHLAGERFAARFAAKEATLKVLRPTEADGVAFTSIEVTRAPQGWCDIVLHGGAKRLAQRNGIRGLTVSMSHEHEYAIATVVGHRLVSGS